MITKGMDILAYEIRRAFLDVRPEKVSYGGFLKSREESKASSERYKEMDELLDYLFIDSTKIIQISSHLFRIPYSFAEDRNFKGLVEKEPQILWVTQNIKRIYHNEIVKYHVSPESFIRGHLKPLIEILDFRLSPEDFYERALLIKKNLEEKGITEIDEEIRYKEIYEDKKQRKKEERNFLREVYGLNKEKQTSKQIQKPIQKSPRFSPETIFYRKLFNQPIANQIRFSPGLEQSLQNPETQMYIPPIRANIRDYLKEGIRLETENDFLQKLNLLFKNKSQPIYEKFINSVKRNFNIQTFIFNNIIKRYKKIEERPVMFRAVNLSSGIVNQISNYNKLDEKVKQHIASLKKGYNKSLINLIHESYIELLKTPGILN